MHCSPLRSRNLSSLHRTKYKIFQIENLHSGRNSHVLCLRFFSHFFKTEKDAFRFFQNTGLPGAREPKHHTHLRPEASANVTDQRECEVCVCVEQWVGGGGAIYSGLGRLKWGEHTGKLHRKKLHTKENQEL